MSDTARVLAIDLGASGGRALAGFLEGEKIRLEEVHRFSNDPVYVQGTLYWDVLRLLHEIKKGLVKAKHFIGEGNGLESISVDTWGVDFALLDEKGRLLENPVHYRDRRTKGVIERAFTRIAPQELYAVTGNQFLEFNTIFQLFVLQEQKSIALQYARTLLMMPDLFHYFLSGVQKTEHTIASTTQLYDAAKRDWAGTVIEKMGFRAIFPSIVPSGTVLGTLTKDIQEELSLPGIKVIAGAGHDTKCALAAIPAQEPDFIFISCGTWSLLGTELPQPLTHERSFTCNIANEAAYGGKIAYLKNIVGLWLVQESKRHWEKEGLSYDFKTLDELSLAEPAFRCFIDPDDPVFVPTGNIPRRIQEYCRKTGQWVPGTPGEIIRCIQESLAFKYRQTIEEIAGCTGKEYDRVYMVGGGVQSKALCQMTADACKKEVSAGPVEATGIGNILIQLLALGKIQDIAQGRKMIRASQEIVHYYPQDNGAWEEAYRKYLSIILKK